MASRRSWRAQAGRFDRRRRSEGRQRVCSRRSCGQGALGRLVERGAGGRRRGNEIVCVRGRSKRERAVAVKRLLFVSVVSGECVATACCHDLYRKKERAGEGRASFRRREQPPRARFFLWCRRFLFLGLGNTVLSIASLINTSVARKTRGRGRRAQGVVRRRAAAPRVIEHLTQTNKREQHAARKQNASSIKGGCMRAARSGRAAATCGGEREKEAAGCPRRSDAACTHKLSCAEKKSSNPSKLCVRACVRACVRRRGATKISPS